MLRPIHFGITATDPASLQKFYGDMFGWTFEAFMGDPTFYWGIKTGDPSQPGIDGGMSRRSKPKMQPDSSLLGCVVTIDVPNVDEYMEKAVKNGGTINDPKMPIPGMGWLGYCRDPDGNIFGLIQYDPSAK